MNESPVNIALRRPRDPVVFLIRPDRPHRKQKDLKGVRFVDLPGDWCCPNCGAGKHMFKAMAGSGSVKEGGE